MSDLHESGLRNVTVVGTGVLGSQIIMQAAYHGKHVTAYDLSDDLLAKLPGRFAWMRGEYRRDLPDFDAERFDRAVDALTTTTFLESAVADADLTIEAVPEDLRVKKEVWRRIGHAAPDKTVFTTNTSSLRPSDFADESGRPEKFLALHFANLVWSHNTGEVMMAEKTGRAYFDAVLGFAAEIGLEPIAVHRETPGYILNSLLIPLLDAAAYLYVDGVAEPADIDKVWRIAMGASEGPFEVYDTVGFRVARNIGRGTPRDGRLHRFAELLEESIEAGRSGLADREGFFSYDAEGDRQQQAPGWGIDQ